MEFQTPIPVDESCSTSKDNLLEAKSAGRWTKEEHQKFVEALKLFGKNWKKVEEYVGTRTGAQIRSHAQKFFNRLQRDLGAENTTTTTTSPQVTGNIRKWSCSSVSTNTGSLSDEDLEKKSALKDKKLPPVFRKMSEDIKPSTGFLNPVPPQAERKSSVFVQDSPSNPVEKSENEKLTYSSFYEMIMEQLKIVKKDQMTNLKLSDLVDMTSRVRRDRYMTSFESFRPSFRRASFSCYGRSNFDEFPLRKQFMYINEF